MTPNKLKLSVIVLFYNGEDWLESCLSSLTHQSFPKDHYELILVDNGGSTPSIVKYQGQSNITLVHFHKNRGFAEGNNRAIGYARADLILLLNQDVIVHPHCLQNLMSAFDEHPEAGIISTSMQMVMKNDQISPEPTIPEKAGFFDLTRFGYAEYHLTRHCHELIPIHFASGNGLGFRKSILKDIDSRLFDARLGNYAEDLDLSIRMKKTSWKMFGQPDAVIFHFRDNAFGGKPIQRLKKLIHVSSNRLLVYYMNLSLSHFLMKTIFLVPGIPLKVGKLDGKHRFHLIRFLCAAALIPLVLFDFIRKIFNYMKIKYISSGNRIE